MKKWYPFLALAAIILLACNLPFKIVPNTPTDTVTPPPVPTLELPTAVPTEPPTAEPTATSAPQGTPYNQDGIQFTLPACLASSAAITTAAAQPPDPNGGPMEFYPQHRVIQFSGYPLSGKFFEPVVRVYPIADYIAMNAVINTRVADMTNLLNSQSSSLPQSIPLLPIFNAAQVFHMREEYLNFQDGLGIGFLTEYAQFYDPVNNHDLFYAYQGISADGKYWVSAILPVNAPFLPPSYDSTEVPPNGVAVPQFNDPNYENAMQTYYTAITAVMTSAAEDAYTPSLVCVKSFLQSLNIQAP